MTLLVIAVLAISLAGVPWFWRKDIVGRRTAEAESQQLRADLAERDAEIDRLSTFIDQQADMHASSAAEWSDRCQQITAIALSLDCEERTS